MKTKISVLIPILGIALCTSCTSPAIKSTLINLDPKLGQSGSPDAATNHAACCRTEAECQDKPVEGIAYSLPMVKIHLTAVLTNAPNPDATNIYFPVISASNSYTSTITYLSTNGVNALITTNITSVMASNSVLAVRGNTNRFAYVVTIDPVIQPDPDKLYALKLTDSAISTDTFGFTVDPTNNFLQTVNASNVDQTILIVEELAKTAAEAAELSGNPFAGFTIPKNMVTFTLQPNTGDTDKTTLINPPPGQIELLFDPTSPDELAAANGKLMRLLVQNPKASNAGDICPIRLSTKFREEDIGDLPAAFRHSSAPKHADGVLYRPLLPFYLEVYNTMGSMGTNSIQYLVRSPNRSPIFKLSAERALFVTRTTSIGFNNGFLQSANYSNPSQLAAGLGLPLLVISDIFSTTTNLFQSQMALISTHNTLVAQETAATKTSTNVPAK